jgi:hypothetical protein
MLHAWRRNDLRSINFRLFEVKARLRFGSVRLPSVFPWWWRYVTGARFRECNDPDMPALAGRFPESVG